MSESVLDTMTGHLQALLAERDAFETRHGKKAAVFLDHLPALFRLFHRLTFEFQITAAQRQKSASVAVYIAEHQDFVGEAATHNDQGSIGDTRSYWCFGRKSRGSTGDGCPGKRDDVDGLLFLDDTLA